MIAHAHQRNVDAVGGGAAHHSGHDHICLGHARGRREVVERSVSSRTFSTRFRTSSRACSPNSHSLRESFSTVAVEGGLVPRSTFADFFLKASTRCADSATRLENLGSRSAVFTNS